MSTDKQMDKETVVYTYSGILFSLFFLKKKETLQYATICINLEDIMLSETRQLQKDKIIYDSTYMRFQLM